MKNYLFFPNGIALALILGFIPTLSVAQDLGANVYLEVATDELSLFAPTILSNHSRALAPKMNLPEDSILAIDVRTLNTALAASLQSPERVNFPYLTAETQTEAQRGTSWVCGFRVVDATDEDLRESPEVERTDFCITSSDLSTLRAMPTNPELVRAAFNAFISRKDNSALETLAKEEDRKAEERERGGILFPIAADAKMISPLRNCAQGCLAATSEFGMRKHPVLRKRRLHKGIDLRAKTGTQVVSVLSGTILANRTEYGYTRSGKGKKKKTKKKIKGYGHYVIVIHPEANLETLYAHLDAFKSQAGEKVTQGQLIALSGNTGIGTAPHLHFETHIPGKKGAFNPANPRTFMGHLFDSVAAFFDFFILRV